MSTVTAHTLFSRAARYSATGAASASLGCPKPSVVSLPFDANSGSGKKKTTPRSLICHYADPDSINHPNNIPPIALVNPSTPTATRWWKIETDKKNSNNVVLTFFSVQDKVDDTLEVGVDGNVLVVTKRQPKTEEGKQKSTDVVDDISFHVRLLVPDSYDKDGIKAVLNQRNLLVTVPKSGSLYKKVDVVDG